MNISNSQHKRFKSKLNERGDGKGKVSVQCASSQNYKTECKTNVVDSSAKINLNKEFNKKDKKASVNLSRFLTVKKEEMLGLPDDKEFSSLVIFVKSLNKIMPEIGVSKKNYNTERTNINNTLSTKLTPKNRKFIRVRLPELQKYNLIQSYKYSTNTARVSKGSKRKNKVKVVLGIDMKDHLYLGIGIIPKLIITSEQEQCLLSTKEIHFIEPTITLPK